MINNIAEGEIVHCNMHFKTKKGIVISKGKIFSRNYSEEIQINYNKDKDASFLKKHDLKEDCTLIKIDIISHHGFKNNPTLR